MSLFQPRNIETEDMRRSAVLGAPAIVAKKPRAEKIPRASGQQAASEAVWRRNLRFNGRAFITNVFSTHGRALWNASSLVDFIGAANDEPVARPAFGRCGNQVARRLHRWTRGGVLRGGNFVDLAAVFFSGIGVVGNIGASAHDLRGFAEFARPVG